MVTGYDQEHSTQVLKRATSARVKVGPSRFEVIDEEGCFRVLQYQPNGEVKFETPVLIVSAFINRPYVLDMNDETSVIQKYLKAGLRVYLIDWGYPKVADRCLELDDYLDYIGRSVRRIKKRDGVSQVTLHGYCLGGTLSAVYASLFRDNVRNLVLQATPIDFDTDNLLALWARSIDTEKVEQSASGESLNAAFLMVDPVKLILKKYKHFLETTGEEQVNDFLRMDHWIFDSPDVPVMTYRQYIKSWYQDNSLIKGEFRALGRRVDLGEITVPVLALVADYDHIAPPESQMAILDVVSSQDKKALKMAKGHIGITTSKASHTLFWPEVVRWLERRS